MQLAGKVTTVALWVRTGQGRRLVRLDALSNEPFTQREFADFKVNITSAGVREKSQKLRASAQRYIDLFSEEEQRRMEEAAQRAEAAAERERQAAQEREAEAARREREREEMRRRNAARRANAPGQWWKAIHTTGGEREIAKWTARLKRFQAIAESSTEDGERVNARRLAENAQRKIEELRENEAAGAKGPAPEVKPVPAEAEAGGSAERTSPAPASASPATAPGGTDGGDTGGVAPTGGAPTGESAADAPGTATAPVEDHTAAPAAAADDEGEAKELETQAGVPLAAEEVAAPAAWPMEVEAGEQPPMDDHEAMAQAPGDDR